jgi:hypothetical protein
MGGVEPRHHEGLIIYLQSRFSASKFWEKPGRMVSAFRALKYARFWDTLEKNMAFVPT